MSMDLGLWLRRLLVPAFILLGAAPARSEFKYLHNPTSERLVVFVHGLFGDMRQTFATWPTMMASDKEARLGGRPLSDHAIALLGYPAGAGDTLSIPEVESRLLADLERHGVAQKHKDIIFIAHSLGGLVLKRMLIGQSVGARSQLSNATKLVVLIASPAGGSWIAELVSPVASRLFGHRLMGELKSRENNSLMQSIQTDWERIVKQELQQRPYIACAYEKLSYFGVVIVPETRADQQCDQKIAVNANHEDIVKPSSRQHDIYKWTAELIASYSRHKPNSAASPAAQAGPTSPAGPAALEGARGPVPRAVIYAEQLKHFKTALRDSDGKYLDHLMREGFRLRASDLCSEMENVLYRWANSSKEFELAAIGKLMEFSDGQQVCERLGNKNALPLDHWILEHVVEKVLFSCSKRSEAPLYIKAIDRIIANQRASPAFRDAARNYVVIPQQMRELTPQRIVEVCSDALLDKKGEQSHLRGAILRCLFPTYEGTAQHRIFRMTVFTRLSSRPDREKQIKAEVAGYQCKSLVKRVAFDGASFEPALARWSK